MNDWISVKEQLPNLNKFRNGISDRNLAFYFLFLLIIGILLGFIMGVSCLI